jgi:hypothetical protein
MCRINDNGNTKAMIIIKEKTIQIMARGGDKIMDYPTINTNVRITTSNLLNKIKLQSWRKH